MPNTMHDPLFFEPVFRQYLWGGRRLESVLNKAIGPEPCYAESWELVDHGDDQSVARGGRFAGMTLHELIARHAQELLGSESVAGQFPLLLKYLDCNRVLSVQVHPGDAYAQQMNPPDWGKTEAWYIIDAQPGSRIYAGLKSGVGPADLRAACDAGQTEDVLHTLEPAAGDCVFIPAGTVHALGSGLLVAEIQQSSDTTFRLFDWNRVDQDGNARPLHIEQAIEVTDYDRGPVAFQVPQPLADHCGHRLVQCDKFVLDRYQGPCQTSLASNNRFQILTLVGGEARLNWGDGQSHTLSRGQTTLIPAALASIDIRLQNPKDCLLLASQF